jgi:hypothetical protein
MTSYCNIVTPGDSQTSSIHKKKIPNPRISKCRNTKCLRINLGLISNKWWLMTLGVCPLGDMNILALQSPQTSDFQSGSPTFIAHFEMFKKGAKPGMDKLHVQTAERISETPENAR